MMSIVPARHFRSTLEIARLAADGTSAVNEYHTKMLSGTAEYRHTPCAAIPHTECVGYFGHKPLCGSTQ